MGQGLIGLCEFILIVAESPMLTCFGIVQETDRLETKEYKVIFSERTLHARVTQKDYIIV